MKTTKKKVGYAYLVCNTMGVERHVRAPRWGLE